MRLAAPFYSRVLTLLFLFCMQSVTAVSMYVSRGLGWHLIMIMFWIMVVLFLLSVWSYLVQAICAKAISRLLQDTFHAWVWRSATGSAVFSSDQVIFWFFWPSNVVVEWKMRFPKISLIGVFLFFLFTFPYCYFLCCFCFIFYFSLFWLFLFFFCFCFCSFPIIFLEFILENT